MEAWIKGIVVIFSTGVVLWIAKRILFHFLKRWSHKTATTIDDQIIRIVSGPINILLVAVSVGIGMNFLPLSPSSQQLGRAAIKVLTILAGIYLVDRLLIFAHRYNQSRSAFLQTSSSIIQTVIHALVFGLGGLVVLDSLGISITPILASLGVGSLAVALALQDTLANFFSGIYLSIEKPLEVGHFIRLDSGEEGYVDKIGWRSIRVRMLPNNTVVVPNSKLAGSHFTNFYLPSKELAVLVEVGVHYDSDLKRVEQITIDAAKEVMREVKGGVAGFDPFIRYHTFGESSIDFTVILRAQEFTDQYLVKHEFVKRLHERYKKEGVVIPFPIRTLDLPSGARII